MLNDKVYNVLKWACVFFMPAFAKFIENTFSLWGIPYGDKIASQIIYVQVFLGAILCVSSVKYYLDQKNNEKNEGEADE